jgi:predicted amidohydrolase
MQEDEMARVAVLQIERSSPEEELASCLQQIERAVENHGATILVCPELRVDSDEGGGADEDSLIRTQERFTESAQRHRVWIALSLVSARGSLRSWLGPEGPAPAAADGEAGLTISTPHGTIGLCPGRAVLQSGQTRALVLAGVALVCAPVAVCSAAESALHVPARAVENGVYVAVAAMFEKSVRPYAASLPTLPPELPGGAAPVRGTVSQIVGPNGKPLAVAVLDETSIAVADIELGEPVALADGTPLIELRRPEIYRSAVVRARAARECSLSPLRVAAVDVPYEGDSAAAIAAAVAYIEPLASEDVALIVLPELFCFDLTSDERAAAASDHFLSAVRSLARACRGSAAHVVTSLVERSDGELSHVGLVIGQAGIVARQPQLHLSRRHGWLRPGRRTECVRLPWGNLVLAVGEDALVPELFWSFGLIGADLVAAPLSARHHGIAAITLPALASELDLGVVAAVRSEHEPDEVKAPTSFIVDPGAWPARRALPGERVLQGSLALRALRRSAAASRTDAGQELNRSDYGA